MFYSIALNMKTNLKAFWHYVKATTGTSDSVSILQKADGTSAIEDEDKAEVLNQFFACLQRKKKSCTGYCTTNLLRTQ